VKTRSALLAACVLAAGCGGGKNPAPKPISGPAKEVADVVQRLQTATARRDFATICDDLLASATRRQAGGPDCARVLGERASDVRRPRIAIQAIEVDGARAQARVRTTARGQAAVIDVLRLVREDGRFRISSLGG
jgi:hypothetical protein